MAVEQKAGLDARVEAAKALTRHIIGWGDALPYSMLKPEATRVGVDALHALEDAGLEVVFADPEAVSD